MNTVRLVIPDLFLPKDFAAEVSAGLSLPALEKMLGRGNSETPEPAELEILLCELFCVPCQADAPIAPISAAFDGLTAGCWLRADPVHLNLQRNQLLLAGVQVSSEEAAAFCASLNEYFAGQGMEFFAPLPQRWYVRVDAMPHIRTRPLSQVMGGDVRGALPTGEDAQRWHQVLNEIQMLLFAHPLNEARDARGTLAINSLWLWGAGHSENLSLLKNYDNVSSDEVLVEMFAAVAGVSSAEWTGQWRDTEGRQLLVWTGLRSALQSGDLAAWRSALQDFEIGYARPLWQALRSGTIARLQIDILSGNNIRRVLLTRGDTWAFWRRIKRLAEYSLV
jgi:hypothetical protein